MLNSFLAAGFIALMPCAAVAGTFEDGKAAYDRQDYATAFKIWLALAEQGNAHSQLGLGDMYVKGLGVSANFVEAAKWYRRAAEQWNPGGMAALAGAYYQGKGVPRNYVLAHMWANLAASRGHAKARIARDAIVRLMTTEQIAEAQRLAREWIVTHPQ